MARKTRITRNVGAATASRVFLCIGVLSVLLLVATVVLIVMDPTMRSPYLTGLGALCTSVVGFGSYARLTRIARAEGSDTPDR